MPILYSISVLRDILVGCGKSVLNKMYLTLKTQTIIADRLSNKTNNNKILLQIQLL